MLTAMYLRKSRQDDPDEDEVQTLRRHREQLMDTAKKIDLSVTAIYQDVKSGDTLYSRPEMLRLLSDVENKKYEAVLCMDIDRLGRSAMSEQGVVLETLQTNNVKIITPLRQYNLNDESDLQATEFESFFARYELRTIKKRFQRGRMKTINDGGYVVNAPYGYRGVRIDKKPTLEIIEEEAAFVRMIYNLYIDGKGGQAIADFLNESGATPRRATKFGRTTVIRMIMNPVYIGKNALNKVKHFKATHNRSKYTVSNRPEEWVIVDAAHPAIISDEVYYRANEILKNRYHPPYNTGELKNPLSGIVICGTCGRMMTRLPHSKKKGTFALMCPTAGCCMATRLDRVETRLLEYLMDYAASIEIMGKPDDFNKNDVATVINSTKKELYKTEQQKEKLHDLLEQGVYTTAVFLERSELIANKITTLLNTIKECERQVNRRNKNISLEIRNALVAYERSSIKDKNEIIKNIIANAFYFKPKSSKPDEFQLSITIQEDFLL